jgi:UrcA family protein
MMNTPFRPYHALIGFGLLFAISGPSVGAVPAPSGSDVPRVTVRYSPAELTEQKGADQLYRRIQFAARQVCGSFDSRELALRRVFRKCYENAVDDAVAQVNSTMLTAVHRIRTQRVSAS